MKQSPYNVCVLDLHFELKFTLMGLCLVKWSTCRPSTGFACNYSLPYSINRKEGASLEDIGFFYFAKSKVKSKVVVITICARMKYILDIESFSLLPGFLQWSNSRLKPCGCK